jgi:hypothetical protein
VNKYFTSSEASSLGTPNPNCQGLVRTRKGPEGKKIPVRGFQILGYSFIAYREIHMKHSQNSTLLYI